MPTQIVDASDLARDIGHLGPLILRVFDVLFSGSYVQGGEPFVPRDVGLHGIIAVQGLVVEGSTQNAANLVVWNNATGKLALFISSASAAFAERAAGAYAVNTSGRLLFLGY